MHPEMAPAEAYAGGDDYAGGEDSDGDAPLPERRRQALEQQATSRRASARRVAGGPVPRPGAEAAALEQALVGRVCRDRFSGALRRRSSVSERYAAPDIARDAGFERPISHGLNTFGLACRKSPPLTRRVLGFGNPLLKAARSLPPARVSCENIRARELAISSAPPSIEGSI